jgi:hypothetical protein
MDESGRFIQVIRASLGKDIGNRNRVNSTGYFPKNNPFKLL